MDEMEFCRYADLYKDMIYRIALNFFGCTQDAEDIVQEVLIKLYIKGGRLKGNNQVKFWLIRVTLNACKSQVRSRGRRHAPLEIQDIAVPFRREEEYALFSVVMSLPEKYRTVLYLFYYEELTAREISDVLDIKESAVTTRLARARNMLRSQLVEEDGYGL